MSAPPGFNGLWRYDWDSPQFDQRAADAMGCLSLATKSTVTSAVALTGNAANLVDGTIIKSGDVLTIASTGRGTATNITFGASESLAQLNAALAANNLTASLDSSNKLVITTTNDVASSTIGVVAYPGAGTGNVDFRRCCRPGCPSPARDVHPCAVLQSPHEQQERAD